MKKLTQLEHRKYIINRIYLISFILLLLVHLADSITTIIGLSLGAVESNPIVAYFFTYGTMGHFMASLWAIGAFVFVILFCQILCWLYKKMTYQEPPIALIGTLVIIYTTTIFLGLLQTVISNILIIIKLM